MALMEVLHDNQELKVPGTRRGEPLVRSIMQEQLSHESELGLAFTWVSANADIDAGDTILIIRNTSDQFLVLSDITAMPANVACEYSINFGNSTTAFAGGSAVTALNMNRGFASKSFDYDAHTDETAISDGTQGDGIWCPADRSISEDLHGFILGKYDFIQVNQETESTSGRIIVKGFFIPELI